MCCLFAPFPSICSPLSIFSLLSPRTHMPGEREASMAEEGGLQFNEESMAGGMLQQNRRILSENDLASRHAQEAALSINEAARWLRRMVGIVLGKDLPADPSEEDFRLGVRSGIILCNALNKVQPGAVPKIVAASDTACQYVENIRNFLVALDHMGIPTFPASDLEKGGESARIVNCVLALKSYHEWKQSGEIGEWKFEGNSMALEHKHVRSNSADVFLGLASRYGSPLSSKECSPRQDIDGMSTSPDMQKLVREMLADKKREDIPMIVEHMIGKLMQEFEQTMSAQDQLTRMASQDNEVSGSKEMGKAKLIRTTSQDNGIPSSSKTGETKIQKQLQTASQEKDVSSLLETGQTEVKDVSSLLETGQTEVKDVSSLLETEQTEVKDVSSLLETEQTEVKDVPSSLKTEQTEVNNAARLLRARQIEENNAARLLRARQIEENNAARLLRARQIEAQRLYYNELKRRESVCRDLIECQQRSIEDLKNTIHFTKEQMRVIQLTQKEQLEDLGKHMHALARAANAYRKVMDENRKLFKQVQELKGDDCDDAKELEEQIAALKAALAQKEGEEGGSLQRSPDSWAARSASSASWNDVGDTCKTEGGSESTSTRHSLDSQDTLLKSPSWPSLSSPGMIQVRQSTEGNHQKSSKRGGSKVHPEQSFDMDDGGSPTSDTSEADNQQQVSRSSSLPNVTESNSRRPNPKPATKSQERNPVPQPTKKLSTPASTKTGRQVVPGPTAAGAAAAARRKPVKGK